MKYINIKLCNYAISGAITYTDDHYAYKKAKEWQLDISTISSLILIIANVNK